MKKLIFSALGLAMLISASAQTTDNNIEATKKQAVETVQQAPVGTKWGITEIAKDNVVISSPLGDFDVTCKDGVYSYMGLTARVVSVKNGVYTLSTSIGNFAIDTHKLTVTKL